MTDRLEPNSLIAGDAVERTEQMKNVVDPFVQQTDARVVSSKSVTWTILNDPRLGTTGNDSLYALNNGDYVMYGYDGNDTLVGAGGNDLLVGGSGNNMLFGGAGGDILAGGNGAYQYEAGGAGNDLLLGGNGTGFLYGGDPSHTDCDVANDSDLLIGLGSGTTLDGGIGNDLLIVVAGGAESLYGGQAWQYIVGNDANDYFDNANDSDILLGGFGNDTLDGGRGNDILFGGAGNDLLIYDPEDLPQNIQGGDGNDTLSAAGWNELLPAGGLYDGHVRHHDGEHGGVQIVVEQTNDYQDIEVFVGSDYNDTLDGGLFHEHTLMGGAGNDVLMWHDNQQASDFSGGAGNDFVAAENSEHPVFINMGSFTVNDIEGLIGSHYNDTLIGTGGNDFLDGNAGDDSVVGGAGNDMIAFDSMDDPNWIYGGDGVDTLTVFNGQSSFIDLSQYGNDIEVLNGGSGSDTLLGREGNDSMFGGDGDDQLFGRGGNDILCGDGGNDTLRGDGGSDTLFGGDGNDMLVYDRHDNLSNYSGGNGNDMISAQAMNDIAGVDINLAMIGSDIEEAQGSNLSDRIDGRNSGTDTLDGGQGADVIVGHNANDLIIYDANDYAGNIWGGGGEDSLAIADGVSTGVYLDLARYHEIEVAVGGNGSDTLHGAGTAETLFGGAGTDTFIYESSNNKSNLIGGDGNDIIDASGWVQGLTDFDLRDYNHDIEGLRGTVFNDRLIGSDRDDILDGNRGADTIQAGDGNDLVIFDPEDDGHDVDGGNGNDILDASAHNDNIVMNLSVDANFEVAIGGNGDDTITGASGLESLYGGAGCDAIYAGNDGALIVGGNDFDTLYGGMGNDVIDGGNDCGDIIHAGGGNDLIIYDSHDLPGNVDGGSGMDTLDASNAVETTPGTGIQLALPFYQNIEAVIGTAFGDTLVGTGNSQLLGNGGNDWIYVIGNDSASGGDGDDNFLDALLNPIGMTLDLHSGQQYNDFQRISGTRYNDVIYTADNAGDDKVYSNGGNDTVYGGDGNDEVWFMELGDIANLHGGGGYNWLGWQGTGAVRLDVSQLDNFQGLFGGFGNDTLIGDNLMNSLNGRVGNDLILGNGGGDWFAYYASDNDTVVAANDGQSDTLDAAYGNAMFLDLTNHDPRSHGVYYGIDVVKGSYLANDTIIGCEANETLMGDSDYDATHIGCPEDNVEDPDSLDGGAGNDWLDGGDGNDTLDGGLGNDTLMGGTGNDLLLYDAADNPLNVQGGEGNDTLSAERSLAGVLIQNSNADPFEWLVGSSYNDVLTGSNDADILDGNGGNDTLLGGAGDDRLIFWQGVGMRYDGGAGNDTLDASSQHAGITVDLNDTVYFRNFEIVTGSAWNDTVSGIAADEWICGGNGADLIYGNGGNDTLDGGNDADCLYGDDGNDVLFGGNDLDVLYGGNGDDTLDGGGDDQAADSLYGGSGNDQMKIFGDSMVHDVADGGDGNDTLDASGFSDALDLYLATDTRYTHFEAVLGTGLNDTLRGGTGHSSVNGGSGDDVIWYSTSDDADYVLGGDGNDTLCANDQVSNLVIKMQGNEYQKFEFLISGSGDDLLWGSNGDEEVLGGSGSDTINGRSGNDTLDGQAGADCLYGGAGNDYLWYDPSDVVIDGGDVNDQGLDQALGTDTLSAANQTAGVAINLGTATNIHNIQYLLGSTYADQLTGSDQAETINGGGGADTILAGGGDDWVAFTPGSTLDGGGGANTLFVASNLTGNQIINLSGDIRNFQTIIGGIGNDLIVGSRNQAEELRGGPSTDAAGYTNSIDDGSDTLDGGGHGDTLYGSYGNDYIYWYNDDNSLYVRGGDGVDTLDACAWENDGGLNPTHQGVSINLMDYYDFEYVLGGNYNDYLTGIDGVENLNGGGGNDTLIGGEGTDTLIGGAGNDLLYGGVIGLGSSANESEADVFEWLYGDGNDTIADFHSGNELTGTSMDDLLLFNNVDPSQCFVHQAGSGNDAIIDIAGSYTLDLNQMCNHPGYLFASFNGGAHSGMYMNHFDGMSWSGWTPKP